MPWILIRSKWPRVLWKPVTLWLVKREVRSGQLSTTSVQAEGDHAMRTTFRFRRNRQNRSRARDTQPIRGVSACKEVQALAPPGSWRKIWVEVLSLSICLPTHLSDPTETATLSRIKCERYIFIKMCISFVHWISYYDYGCEYETHFLVLERIQV